MNALEVIALMVALPGAILALRELRVRRRAKGLHRRSLTELKISVRFSIRRR